MTKEYIISADSHVNPRTDLWTRSAPQKLKEDMDLDGVDAEVLYFGGPVTHLRALLGVRRGDGAPNEIPYLLERLDQAFEKHRFWTKSVITEKSSIYWYRQGHATFIRDLAGVAERCRAGVRKIMWSTDYPHSDSTWPKSREALALHFKDVPAEERALVTGGNAVALYRVN